MTDIKKMLLDEIDSWKKIGAPCEMQEFVLANATVVAIGAAQQERLEGKQCFANAGRQCIESSNLIYCEGYGFRPNLGRFIHHAWCWDREANLLIDNTWDNPKDSYYIGVAWSKSQLMDQVLDNGVWGILDLGRGFNREAAENYQLDI